MSTQKEETRARLLDAARRLLVKRGFHGVSLEDIAEEAGVSRQAVYKSHFTSKADLLLALVRYVQFAENFAQFIRPVSEADSGPAMLEATLTAIVRIETKVHDLGLVLSAAALTDAGARTAWRDRMDVKRNALHVALTRTESEGLFNPKWKVDEAVDLLAALHSVDTYEQLVVERGWTPDALIRRSWELCRANFLIVPERARSAHQGARRKR